MSKSEKAAGAAEVDHGELKETALALFAQVSQSQSRGYDHEATALECFRRAKAFLVVSEKVEYGELSAEPEKSLPTEYIEVPVWRQRTDEKWEPVRDPITKKPVTERAPVDHFAYAPNLPADHPINLRFKPLDGITFEERQEAAKAAREVEASARSA